MASLYNADLKPMDPNGRTHPYDHATKLFLADNYRLTPKQSFLYYVVLNVDTTAASILQSATQSIVGNDVISSQTSLEQIEAGMLVKRVELPRFSPQTKTLNAYNKKNIVQTQLQYDPVTITFHDDNADVVTNFWNDYYTYYYRDSDYAYTPERGSPYYNTSDEYSPRLTEGWGYGPRNGSLKPFLKSIQIFSLHQKRFTEYTLVNPMITSWRHGQHSADASNELMENAMTVAYETVKYRTGYVNGIDVNGFSVLHYDNFESPIATSTTNIYTDGGIIGALAGSAQDLARPDGTTGTDNVFGSLLSAYRLFNQDINFSSVATVALGQISAQVLNGAVNGAINSAFFPTVNGTAGYGTVYSGSQTYTSPTTGTSIYAAPLNSSAVTINGTASSLVSGLARTTVAQATSTLIDKYVRGVSTAQTSPLPGASVSTIFQASTGDGTILTNAQGQAVTTQTVGYWYDAEGNQLAPFTVTTAGNGGLNLSNLEENRIAITTTTDQSGKNVLEFSYINGATVIYDPEANQILQTYPGTVETSVSVPTNTRDMVLNGQTIPATSVQTYTDPRTGITYTVGGTTSAYVTNTLTSLAGLTAGTYIGSGVTQALNSTALGRTVLGQTIATGLGSAAGILTARAVNNGLQPVVNQITGAISQGWDSFSGAIKNVLGTWTGTGGIDYSDPTKNLVTSSFNPDTGFFTNTYKNGEVALVDEFNDVQEILTPGTNASSSWLQSLGSGAGSAADYGTNLIWTDSYGNPVTDSFGGYVYTQQGLDFVNNFNPVSGYSGIDYGSSYEYTPTTTNDIWSSDISGQSFDAAGDNVFFTV